MEMIFARDQRCLDQFLAGTMGAEELRQRIRYDRDWGYPWDGYGRLLETARETGTEVVAADAPPRGGLRLIRRRDRHAAGKVLERIVADPGCRAVVVFGESHMSRDHLPGEVRELLRRSRLARSSIVIVQNVEEIYWTLAAEGLEGTDAVMIDAGRYCAFNASPLAKYEAYRQTLQRWAQQEDEAPDFGPSVHHLIDLLVDYLRLDRYKATVPSPDGKRTPLVDLYPEVIARRDRRRRADPRPRRRGSRPGVIYRPGLNRIDVYSFSLQAAGEAASRFLLAALRGVAGRPRVMLRGPAHPRPGEGSRSAASRIRPTKAGAAGRILDEAFVAFSVRYLDPGVRPRRRGATRSGIVRGQRRGDRLREGERAEVLAAASRVSPRTVERSRRPRLNARRLTCLGESLGEAVYARLQKRSEGTGTRAWLLAVARLTANRAESGRARAVRLLTEGASRVGWLPARGGKKSR
jgi:hypothetical protein